MIQKTGHTGSTCKALALVLLVCVMNLGCNPPKRIKPAVNPQRVISLAPSITETLFAIGAGDKVVGDTIFCNWPPEAQRLPRVGEFSRIYFEKILWLRPDLVIANRDSPSETVGDDLSQYGIPFIVAGAYTLPQTLNMIREIGRIVGKDAAASELADEMRRRSELIENKVKGSRPERVILVYGHDPLILAGPGTFADDLIRRAGGVNIAGDSRIKYPQYSIEKIVLDGPEVILEASHSTEYSSPDVTAIKQFWKQWPDIPAVRNGRVVVVNADLVTRPGPRIVEGLETIAKALHPEKLNE